MNDTWWSITVDGITSTPFNHNGTPLLRRVALHNHASSSWVGKSGNIMSIVLGVVIGGGAVVVLVVVAGALSWGRRVVVVMGGTLVLRWWLLDILEEEVDQLVSKVRSLKYPFLLTTTPLLV